MFYARIAIAEVIDDVDSRDGDSCPCFEARLRLFEKASAPSGGSIHPDDVDLRTITESPPNGQRIPVVNNLGQKFSAGDELIVGQTIDERWVVINGGAAPRIQFVTTGKIVDQAVSVKVLRVQNSAPDLTAGGFLEWGDTLTVYDPFNLFADIETGATGWAYLVAASEDDTSTTGITEPDHPARYEIEECSLPINEVKGTIAACLKADDSSAVVTTSFASGNIRSAYNNVDVPPEASGSGTITANNTFNLDAIEGSVVVIQRVTNLGPSEPEDYAVSGGSATSSEWQIIRVEKKIARWIRVIYSSGSWSAVVPNVAWDGFSPFGSGGCDADIVAENTTCLPKNGTVGYAAYFPEDHQYRVMSTASALLGPPGKHAFVKGTGSAGQDPITVVSCNDLVTPKISYTQSEIYGWSTGDTQTESGCINEYTHNADMGFKSALGLKGVAPTFVCGAPCTFTAVETSPGSGEYEWDTPTCDGCDSCVEDSTLPTATAGATHPGTCKNASGEYGLCFQTQYFLYCDPAQAGSNVCIPTTECPPE